MVDMEKIVEYWSEKSLEALDSLRREKADPRNPEIANIVSKNLKILCSTDTLMDDGFPGASAAGDWMAYNSYPDGSSYAEGVGVGPYARTGHFVRNRYSAAMTGRSYGNHSAGTLSRMMDAADPREKEMLERLLRKVDG